MIMQVQITGQFYLLTIRFMSQHMIFPKIGRISFQDIEQKPGLERSMDKLYIICRSNIIIYGIKTILFCLVIFLQSFKDILHLRRNMPKGAELINDE